MDALTVTAVLISVTLGFYKIFEKNFKENRISELEFDQGKAFLRDIIMHGAVGTALGGVCTIVGRTSKFINCYQSKLGFYGVLLENGSSNNASIVFWPIKLCLNREVKNFLVMALNYHILEELKLLIMLRKLEQKRTPLQKLHLIIEAVLGICLIFALAFHVAQVGIIGFF